MQQFEIDTETYGVKIHLGEKFYFKKKKKVELLSIIVKNWINYENHVTMLLGAKSKAGMMYGIIPDYREVARLLPENNLHLFEILPMNVPVRLYLDVDHYCSISMNMEEKEHWLIETCIQVIRSCLRSAFGTEDGVFDDEDVYTCSASGIHDDDPEKLKISLHICIHTPKVFKNTLNLGCFMKYVKLCLCSPPDENMKLLAESLYCKLITASGGQRDDWGMDLFPYNENQPFKLPYQSKPKSTRVQKPYNLTDELSLHFCGLYGNEYENVAEDDLYYDISQVENILVKEDAKGNGIVKVSKRSLLDKKIGNYYKNLFPVDCITEFLKGFCNGLSLNHKEIAFTTINGYYSRHISVSNAEELSAAIRRNPPLIIHTGALYTDPKLSKVSCSTKFIQAHEFVIDIDITDMGELRHCCEQTDLICSNCWGFIRCNVKVLKWICEEKLGIELLWCFSGGKGVHGWLCDPTLGFRCSDKFRSMVTDRIGFFDVYKDANGTKCKRLKQYLFSNEDGSYVYKLLLPMFKSHIEMQQSVFVSSKQRKLWISWLREFTYTDKEKGDAVAIASEVSNPTCWTDFEKCCELAGNEAGWMYKRLLVFMYCLPRIDEKVMIEPKHLTKLPFSIHGSSGLVAIPFDTDPEGEILRLRDYTIRFEQLTCSSSNKMETSESPIQIFKESQKTMNLKTRQLLKLCPGKS